MSIVSEPSTVRPETAVGFTPGPWRVIPYDAGDVDYLSGVPAVVAAEGYDCAIVHWHGFKHQFWQSARGDREMHANARLIAAAPAGYALAERLIAYLSGFNPDELEPEEVELLTSAQAFVAQARDGSAKPNPTGEA